MQTTTCPSCHEEAVIVRPAQPTDTALLEEMHERLSPDTIYYRYLSPRKPTPEELQQEIQLATERGATLVATTQTPAEAIVGLAFYVIDQDAPEKAEAAFLIEDDFQGCGLGRCLFQQLRQQAQMQGIRTWHMSMAADNERMIQLIRRSGLPYTAEYAAGARTVEVALN
jgi:GNAT superfamily N-acetyltransferase